MRIAISGSSGFIGTALSAHLTDGGHEVLRLVRRAPEGPDEAEWHPDDHELDPAVLDGIEAVVNLNGAGVGDRRWTRKYKRLIYNSRVDSTETLATTIAGMDSPPRVFVTPSAIGIYGSNPGRDVLDEDSQAGDSFLAKLCVDWEGAAAPARGAGIAVCHPRFGLVMHHSGGALGRMLPIFRRGLGGPLGRGDQYWSYVSLTDVVRAIRFLVEERGLVGPYNVTAPEPVTNAEFSRELAHALHRPSLMRVPGIGIQLALGEYAYEVLGGIRAVPRRLVEAGFIHEHPDARSVVTAALPDHSRSD